MVDWSLWERATGFQVSEKSDAGGREMLRGLSRFSANESGKITDQLVSVVLVVLVAGGLLVTLSLA